MNLITFFFSSLSLSLSLLLCALLFLASFILASFFSWMILSYIFLFCIIYSFLQYFPIPVPLVFAIIFNSSFFFHFYIIFYSYKIPALFFPSLKLFLYYFTILFHSHHNLFVNSYIFFSILELSTRSDYGEKRNFGTYCSSFQNFTLVFEVLKLNDPAVHVWHTKTWCTNFSQCNSHTNWKLHFWISPSFKATNLEACWGEKIEPADAIVS